MRTSIAVTAAVIMLLVLHFPVIGMSFPGRGPEIRLDGRLNCPYISTYGGTAYLQISLSTSDVDRPCRNPMNIAVVLDRSGSMSDAGKMEYAKQAVLRLVDQLGSRDIVSLVIYDDVIEVPFPAQRVGNGSALRRLIDGIYPRGATNLGGGMMEGFRQVERNLSREYVNRVILLSDGLANRGLTDVHELARIAARNRQRSISLTTMGVGLEYNENLMVSLAQGGGGNYYFIESPNSLAGIMNSELNTLSNVVVQNASIELTLRGGVRAEDVIGCENHGDGSMVIIPVGDLYARDRRCFTVELFIPGGRGVLNAVTGRLRYDSDQIRTGPPPAFDIVVHYTTDAAAIEKNKDWDAQAGADVALSTRAVDHAMRLVDEGRHAEAQQVLTEAQQTLNCAPAAAMSGASAKEIRNQAAVLESYSSILKDDTSDTRRAKKSIQFDNYQRQRRK